MIVYQICSRGLRGWSSIVYGIYSRIGNNRGYAKQSWNNSSNGVYRQQVAGAGFVDAEKKLPCSFSSGRIKRERKKNGIFIIYV